MGSKLSSISKRRQKAKPTATTYLQPEPGESAQRHISQATYGATDCTAGQPLTFTTASHAKYSSFYTANSTHSRYPPDIMIATNLKSTEASHTSNQLKLQPYIHAQRASGECKSLSDETKKPKSAAPILSDGKDGQPSVLGGTRHKVSSGGLHLRPEEDESIYAVIPEPRRMTKRPPTHYERLGISSGATKTAVDLAYTEMRDLARTYAEVGEVEEAYKVLKNTRIRKQYDEEIGIARPDGTRIWRPGEYGHPSQIPTGPSFRKRFPHDTGSYASSRYEKLPRWGKQEMKWDLN